MTSAAAVAGKSESACDKRGSCGCRGVKSPGYLAALTLVAWGVQVPMLLLAVPKFAERLRDFGVQLPEVSVFVLNWSNWMRAPIGGSFATGAMLYAAAIVALAAFAYVLAKVTGGFGRAVVVMLALLGGAIACGQAAAVIVPTMQAQQAIESSNP